jgi:hypothetical protein
MVSADSLRSAVLVTAVRKRVDVGTIGAAPSPPPRRPFPLGPIAGLCAAAAIVGFVLGRVSVRRPAPQSPAAVETVAARAAPEAPAARPEPTERPTVPFIAESPPAGVDAPDRAPTGEIQRLPSPVPRPPRPGKWEPIEGQDWRVLTIDVAITESNSIWSRFSWKLTLKNYTMQSLAFNATIEFQDRNGFILDTDSAYDLRVLHGQTETFTGFALVKAELVDRVDKAVPKVKFRGVLP